MACMLIIINTKQYKTTRIHYTQLVEELCGIPPPPHVKG